ncbi:hepcidin-1 isoform X3 [Carassius gibelio]|uniref:hepcidin-1 isoform X3 n=1 Tax=Carassius gibelio TaxID=101364 RepID=UPI002277436B|nr:hepcidin-1 isoform X3 [Carassius gibelio]
MKFSRVALAALVIIACVCILQTAAVPFTQTEDEHHVQNEHLTETSQEQTNPLAFFRVKRQSHLSLCRYCCNCCRNKGCGYCCKF